MGGGVEEMEMLIDVILQFLIELILNNIGFYFWFLWVLFWVKGNINAYVTFRPQSHNNLIFPIKFKQFLIDNTSSIDSL